MNLTVGFRSAHREPELEGIGTFPLFAPPFGFPVREFAAGVSLLDDGECAVLSAPFDRDRVASQ
ncbi:hypothetical protein [Haloplanus halobius]|uniref:hypothetical protein n=1 Tax=Haloplanus halobius TaxID=2934938 RepID=UPI00200C3A45|nr:hypothetical protein [Haloplanus sp. XH21]